MKSKNNEVCTKDKIMLVALDLFAEKGYEATSVSDIAERLNLTKGALYRHYKNKRDIFDGIILKMEKNDAERAESFLMPTEELTESEESVNAYKGVEIKRLIEYSFAQLEYWLSDPFASKFKKMLMHERFLNAEANALFENYLGTGPLGYVADVFEKTGIQNPRLAALEFYSPMFFAYFSGDFGKNGGVSGGQKTIESADNELIAAHFKKQYDKLTKNKA